VDVNGQTETALKFEDDLAPTANHSGGKDLMKLRGGVAFLPFVGPTGNCSSSAATLIMKEYEAAFRIGDTCMCRPTLSRAWGRPFDCTGTLCDLLGQVR
jgi:hypothetical protein